MEQETIYIKKFETPLGALIAGATAKGICLLEFNDRKEIESEYTVLKKLLNAEIIQDESPFFAPLETQLKEYFAGARKVFDLPLLYAGTPFQQAVWKELQTIPYGATRSYMQQAKALKNAEGIRAIAHANGTNRIAILIPCHRVIGKNGSLTGYGGGLWRKKWLLDLEAKNSGQPVLGLFGDEQITPEALIAGKAVGLRH
jgi:AraC family transcriptional regulator, regulatory protein of adaptative response / methylated-DNA-[protein]-cysteine methyltransferase